MANPARIRLMESAHRLGQPRRRCRPLQLPVSRLEHLMRVESRDFTTGDLTIEELPDPLSASPPTT